MDAALNEADDWNKRAFHYKAELTALRAELEQRYTDTMEAIVARVMYTELPDDPIISTEDADRLNHPYQP